ncbi:MAG: aminotransferase class III-fold pyridoxal phosphate-dependent enzyme [Acetobacteraceae bacterium]
MTNSVIVAAYRQKTPGSERLAQEAAALFPNGVTHDARILEPYGIYVERAQGPHKWDVDGNRYVDFFGGHGALLLGHNAPAVADATARALAAGTHFGANHPAEVRWAQAVQRLVPSAERVRFTSSGTEATLMALRLARAFTGRKQLMRFRGHFHGWHDHMTSGYSSHFEGAATAGVLPQVAEQTVLVDPGDIAGVRAAFAGSHDIAAVILEPTGSSFGQVPLSAEFVQALRAETERAGVLLILDEVVTGFRVSPGGAQVAYGVRPDLTSLAKILAGGLPGGAVAGRRDVLDHRDVAASRRAGREKIQHQGTYNANPVSAAAGAATLEVIEATNPGATADAMAASLRAGLNAAIAAERLPWAAYGTSSGFHLFLNPGGLPIQPETFDPAEHDWHTLKAQPAALAHKLRLALLTNGVDVNGRLGGFLSATHTPDDVAHTVDAFAEAIRMVRREGELAA